MRKLEENLYLLPVELPGSPLRRINCYLILGESRHLLVDTAFNYDECERSVLEQLEEAGAKIEDTDIFITHMHVDHCGLISRLKRKENKIFAGVTDKKLIESYRDPARWAWVDAANRQMGIPQDRLLKTEQQVGYQLRYIDPVEIEPIPEGGRLEYGGFSLTAVSLPGHTPGQTGLWGAKKGYLFSGDHILADISPNITAWDLENDYLKLFRQSLLKVRAMPVKKLFPAHRKPPADVNARIDELLRHHDERMAEVLDVTGASHGGISAYDAALLLKWNMRKPIFEAHPQQVWFACVETLAHLQSLMFEGRVRREERGGVLYYSSGLTSQLL